MGSRYTLTYKQMLDLKLHLASDIAVKEYDIRTGDHVTEFDQQCLRETIELAAMLDSVLEDKG